MSSRQLIYPTIPQPIYFTPRYKILFFEQDTTSANLEPLLQTVDVVIHLAAITDATASINNLLKVERVNYLGTDRVATACTNTALLFSSTTNVYGSTNSIVNQDCTKFNPQNPYANSKIQAEQLLTDIGEKNGLGFATLRLGTIFSLPIGLRFHTAVDKFCWQALNRSSVHSL